MEEIGILSGPDDRGEPGEPPASTIAGRVEAAGGEAVVGTASDLLERSPGAIVARGERALLSIARRAPSIPVLPVDAGLGVRSISATDLQEAVAAVLDGAYDARERRLLDVAVDGERVERAAFDAMLVTRDPAKISEYAVRTGGDLISQFRADGVVVATPAGSGEYAAAAGGPVLAPGTGVAVVPVAPFATTHDHWVVDPERGVELTVERDEGAVELLVDDERVRVVPPQTPVSLTVDGTLSVLVGPHSRSRWS